MITAIGSPFDMTGPEFLSFYLYTAVLVLIVAAALRWQARGGSAASVEIDLCPYEIAYLRDSPTLAVRAAVANLIGKKALEVDPRGAVTRTGIESHAHPLEEAILRLAANPITLRTLERRVSPNLDRIRDRLEELGLLVGSPQRNLARIGELLIWGTVAVGMIKIAVGLARGKPVSYLLFLVVATIALRFVINAVLKLHRTRAGERAIARMQAKYRRESAPQLAQNADTAAHPAGLAYGYDPITMMIALYGMQMVAYHPMHAPMQTMLAPPPPPPVERPAHDANASGSNSGSSCSTSSDSGGSDSGGSSCGSSCSSGCGGCGGGGD